MLRNYLKIAIAVLKRRKFFTFISLFGISFTLTVLMVLTAFIDKIANDKYPDKKRDRCLYIENMQTANKKIGSYRYGPVSFYFLDRYVSSLKTPVKLAITSTTNTTSTYLNTRKIGIEYKYTNAVYWEVLDYEFLEGKPFTAQQVKNGERVTVISDEIKHEYFGDVPSVVGKYIEADNVQYRVAGVVRSAPSTNSLMHSDIYLPYTVSKGNYTYKGLHGNFAGILLAPSKADVPGMKQEFNDMMKKVPTENKDEKLMCRANTYLTNYLSTGKTGDSGVSIAIIAVSVFALLFMLLPALNLVNVNITRIMERSSEIGVRKAFGASSRTLVYQFLVENVILTLCGGLLAVLFTLVIIVIFNNNNVIPGFELSLNFTVLFSGLLVCLFFGLLSGVLPAWRMSRLHVVTALKAQ
jgi:putative ABC transport system permease protein